MLHVLCRHLRHRLQQFLYTRPHPHPSLGVFLHSDEHSRPGSGCGAFALRSLNTSAAAYSDDDQSTRTRGNVNAGNMSFAWMDYAAPLFAAVPSARGFAFFDGYVDLMYDLTSMTAWMEHECMSERVR